MADVNRGNRPLSPHIFIYRPQITSVLSILHRITGVALLLGFALIVWWFLAAATSPEYFEIADGILTSWVGLLVLLGSTWALWYHFCNGIRHLVWDMGYGFDLGAVTRSGWLVVILSLLLTAATWAFVILGSADSTAETAEAPASETAAAAAVSDAGETGADATDDQAGEGEEAEGAGTDAPVEPPATVLVDEAAGETGETGAGAPFLELSPIRAACENLVVGRYPFDPNAVVEAPLTGFAMMFGPGGALDALTEHLSLDIDRSGPVWRWAETSSVDNYAPEGLLESLQAAARIRAIFFFPDGTLGFDMRVTPIALDPSAKQFAFANGGQEITYDHGAIRPVGMIWPSGGSSAWISVIPERAGIVNRIQRRGVWALFRLVEKGAAMSNGATLQVLWSIGGRSAQLSFEAATVENPLTLDALRAFKCPGALTSP